MCFSGDQVEAGLLLWTQYPTRSNGTRGTGSGVSAAGMLRERRVLGLCADRRPGTDRTERSLSIRHSARLFIGIFQSSQHPRR